MIDKEEVFSEASNLKLQPTTIEKDYVLSWVLAGINHHPLLSKILVFKGGTCLKKCFFAKYRFSEDLDFVLIDKYYLNKEFFQQAFEEVCNWIQEESNIEFLSHLANFELYTSIRKFLSIEGKLRYRGPLLHRTNFPKIKLDISSHEELAMNPEKRKILHNYSDAFSIEDKITCYSFEEVFAEKLRAFADRARPRDLFDVIYLNNQKVYPINKPLIRKILQKKCENRKIEYPSMDSISKHPSRKILSTEWENMLGHQISDLQLIDHYLDQLPVLFDWISNEVEQSKV